MKRVASWWTAFSLCWTRQCWTEAGDRSDRFGILLSVQPRRVPRCFQQFDVPRPVFLSRRLWSLHSCSRQSQRNLPGRFHIYATSKCLFFFWIIFLIVIVIMVMARWIKPYTVKACQVAFTWIICRLWTEIEAFWSPISHARVWQVFQLANFDVPKRNILLELN